MIVMLFKKLESSLTYEGAMLIVWMSNQPVRVIQPPSQSSTPAHSRAPRNYQGSNSIRYDELVQTAEQQRRLIDANRRMIRDRETRGNRVDNAPIRLAVLRNEILFEEREMARLKMMERETQQAAARRMIAEKQLNDLQMSYTSQEQHLRTVISKITSLQTQLDILRRRRLVALNAARDQQQRLMSSQMRPANIDSMQTLPLISSSSATTSNNDILRNDTNGSKSSAMALQYSAPHIIKRMDFPENDIGILRQIPPTSDFARLRHPSVDLPHRPRASIEPFQVTHSKSLVDARSEMSSSCPPQLLNKPFGISTSGKDRANFTFADRNSSSPSPPKDPYPTGENVLDNKIAKLEDTFDTVDHLNRKLSSSTSEILEKHLPQQQPQQPKNIIMKSSSIAVMQDEQFSSKDLVDNTKLTRADQISIRPDTLRAAKRRSWALQESASCDETEYIRRILLDEQKKGRTHLLVGCNIGNLFSVPNKACITIDYHSTIMSGATISKPEVIHEEEKEGIQDAATAEYVCELLVKDIQLDELPAEIEQVEECGQEKLSVSKEFAGESTNVMEVQNKTSGIAELIKPLPKKGILRVNKARKVSRKVIFDPLALLLDAALEGEMDLVKASAAKLPDISACNDEGITALHNAICAGHYEIVRYLVDSFADVNAQDSDGWTPLHCAASCNNLPMVKLLVENGACIFAQTLSDLETPAEKCEEDEDGYEGCQLYLKAADQEAGVVNDGLMYAAYDYDKEQEDELSFPVGACLRVLEKGVDGRPWWLCELTTEHCTVSNETSERGLVPRNYLSLYPSLSKRTANFKMFDLTQLPKIHDSKKNNVDVKEWRRSNSSMNEKITEENHEDTIVEQSVPISVS
uniref:SH3 domain-containing protein n=1 Tax=Elaeophora elaphi TaxID=1147741 RepID=A0A0R3RV84_9BILA